MTTDQLGKLRALPIEMENPRSMDEGCRYYAIDLADGRRASVWGDRIEITPAGALIIWRDYSTPDEITREAIEPRINLALAPKTWADVYPASVGNGLPLAVDTVIGS